MSSKPRILSDDVSIVLGGEAGQGIQTIETILSHLFKIAGYHIFSTKEYMSRIRGGSNSTEIRVASKPVTAVVDKIDICIPLDQVAIPHLYKRINPNTIILGDKDVIKTQKDLIHIPFSKLSKEIGHTIYSNTIAVGLIMVLFKVGYELAEKYLKKYFEKKTEEIINKNLQALKKGYELGTQLLIDLHLNINIKSDPLVKDHLLINGAEAVSLGAIAGGCNFIAAYPMSPSTGILTNLAKQAETFDIITEQAEDEISAINMALGAWYAGGRALVSTSGGGFALMTEGLSLAGIIESPLVIHLAQRPGPATGLPTRTEQGDLNLALYGGHGEFPRIILAAGSLEDGFYLTQKAFNLADQYQIPVFLLTDQYYMDSYYNILPFDLSNIKVENHIVKTNNNYQRYVFTQNNISPRGIPNYGTGLVCVDSDEHDESGHITENGDMRTRMVDKRFHKMDSYVKEIIQPDFIGSKNYDLLVICWGSTLQIIKEAIQLMNNDKVALLHYKQVYPLHPETAAWLGKAKKTVIFENNAEGQFCNLVRRETGIEINEKVLKYNGFPFSIEEIYNKLKSLTETL